VVSLLESAGFSKSNPYYIVQQVRTVVWVSVAFIPLYGVVLLSFYPLSPISLYPYLYASAPFSLHLSTPLSHLHLCTYTYICIYILSPLCIPSPLFTAPTAGQGGQPVRDEGQRQTQPAQRSGRYTSGNRETPNPLNPFLLTHIKQLPMLNTY
jgi:hypothetical protein